MNTDSIQLRMRQNNIKKNENKLQQLKQTKHKKNYVRHYCDVCCKNFINSMSYKTHLKTFHSQLNSNKHASNYDESIFKSKDYLFELKSTKNGIGKTDNIFTEFENQMPAELKNDQHRCNVCNTIFLNSIDYMNHEKLHYQTLTINNSSISQKSMTLDDNMALDNADVDGTIVDTTNNDDKSLEISVDSTSSNTSNTDVKFLEISDDSTSSNTSNNDDKSLEISDDSTSSNTSNNDVKSLEISDDSTSSNTSNNDVKSLEISDDSTSSNTSNNDVKSLEIFDDSTSSNTSNNDIKSLGVLDYSTSTSDTSNNDITLDTCNYKIINNSCEGVFTSKSDFEEHQQYYINDNLRTCSNQTNLMFCRPNELNINTENYSISNNQIKSIQKNSWVPDDNHIKALNEMCVVRQPFECEICDDMCEEYDHYQFHQWWSSDEILKCHVCNQQFSDEEQLKLHEYEHVKTHFC